MLRPTMSPGLYYQMVGRGFRLHPGKQNCLVLDFGGNVLRHGPVDAIRIQEGKAFAFAPAKECPECRTIVAAGYSVCPECGHEFFRREAERQAKHDARASSEGILSDEVTITEYPVQDVLYSVHTKRDAPPDHPKTMRVEYQVNLRHYVSEWVCPEHTGYARWRFEKWWKARSDVPPPATADEAAALASDGLLAPTLSITVRTVTGETFGQVIAHTLGEKPRMPGWDEELMKQSAGNALGLADEDIPF